MGAFVEDLFTEALLFTMPHVWKRFLKQGGMGAGTSAHLHNKLRRRQTVDYYLAEPVKCRQAEEPQSGS
jgi:hypothetical protein